MTSLAFGLSSLERVEIAPVLPGPASRLLEVNISIWLVISGVRTTVLLWVVADSWRLRPMAASGRAEDSLLEIAAACASLRRLFRAAELPFRMGPGQMGPISMLFALSFGSTWTVGLPTTLRSPISAPAPLKPVHCMVRNLVGNWKGTSMKVLLAFPFFIALLASASDLMRKQIELLQC